MSRSYDPSAGFTLVEAMVATALSAVVIAAVGSYLLNFQRASSYSDRRSAARMDALRAGFAAQTALIRRNVSLDVDGSAATSSVKLTTGSTPSLTILTRRSSDTTENRELTFYNVCSPRPAGAPPPPPGGLGRCGFRCPDGQGSSIVVRVATPQHVDIQPLVPASKTVAPGAAADAALCLMKTAGGDPSLPEVAFEVEARLYDVSGKGYEAKETAVEKLSLALRDRNVEMTGHD
jgi:type II secretory pathway pseudopilin PulG